VPPAAGNPGTNLFVLAQALPIGINLTSPVAWFVIAAAFIVVALTVSTRRGQSRSRAATPARYADEWSAAQSRFVDDPRAGCKAAQAIVARMLRERGFALTPELRDRRYRAGCDTTARADASTDDLRRAFTDFRAAFDALVADESELVDP
jgi:hypothetical protein